MYAVGTLARFVQDWGFVGISVGSALGESVRVSVGSAIRTRTLDHLIKHDTESSLTDDTPPTP